MLTNNILAFKYMKIKISSDNKLLLEQILNMHNLVTLIKSVFDKNQNHYYYQVFFKKVSNKKYPNAIL